MLKFVLLILLCNLICALTKDQLCEYRQNQCTSALDCQCEAGWTGYCCQERMYQIEYNNTDKKQNDTWVLNLKEITLITKIKIKKYQNSVRLQNFTIYGGNSSDLSKAKEWCKSEKEVEINYFCNNSREKMFYGQYVFVSMSDIEPPWWGVQINICNDFTFFHEICHPCHCNNKSEVCNKKTGRCESGCAPGFKGENCSISSETASCYRKQMLSGKNTTMTNCTEFQSMNIKWPPTVAGKKAVVACHAGNGNATWHCGTKPVCWLEEPDLSGCAASSIQKLKELAAAIQWDNESSVINVFISLANLDTLSSVADVDETVKLLRFISLKLSLKMTYNDIIKKMLQLLQLFLGHLVSALKNLSALLTADDMRKLVTSLLVAVEQLLSQFLRALTVPTILKFKGSSLDVDMRVVDLSETMHETLSLISGSDWFYLPVDNFQMSAKDALGRVFTMNIPQIKEILSEIIVPDKQLISQHIISLSLVDLPGNNLKKPIQFVMKHAPMLPQMKQQLFCSFWQIPENVFSYYSTKWSQAGCNTTGTNSTHTQCLCNHLTSFAVLMNVVEVEISTTHMTVLTSITYAGFIISLICLSLSWFTFQVFRFLHCERHTIHKNLIFCLFVAELVFLLGIHSTENKITCALVAGILHYFFLACFTWMLLEGIYIMKLITQVIQSRSYKYQYYLFGYVTPAIIVGVSAAIKPDGYGTKKHCWLSTNDYFIWSFTGPVAFVLIINTMVLITAIVIVCQHNAVVFSEKHSKLSYVVNWIKAAFALEILLGVTWSFGYGYINQQTLVMAYLFTIFNSLQGFFIFCLYCLSNMKVRRAYLNFFAQFKGIQT